MWHPGKCSSYYKYVRFQEVCKTSIKTEITPVMLFLFFFDFSLLLCMEHILVFGFLDAALINQDKLLLKKVDIVGSRLKSLMINNTGRQYWPDKWFALRSYWSFVLKCRQRVAVACYYQFSVELDARWTIPIWAVSETLHICLELCLSLLR